MIDCRLEISLVTVCLNLGFLLGLCVCLCKYVVFCSVFLYISGVFLLWSVVHAKLYIHVLDGNSWFGPVHDV